MSYAADIRKCKNPQEAMLLLAGGIDQILTTLQKIQVQPSNEWTDLEWSLAENGDTEILGDIYEQMEANEPTITEIATGDGNVASVVELPLPPSEEKMEARRQFEREYLKIGEALGGEADPAVDYTEIYAKAGPLWLYHGNRDLFMTYDWGVRQAMCQDVVDDAPTAGRLMSLDALKQAGESGPGSVAMGSEASEIPQSKRWWN